MSSYSLHEPAHLNGSGPAGLAWLGAVREVCYPLSRLNPIWIRENLWRSGPPLPLPTVQFPERHPYCEITLSLQGRGIQYIGNESKKIEAGDVMLLGPSLPHTAEAFEYPIHSITVYILPVFFLDMGPNSDGPRLLNRFAADQPISSRIMQLPPAVLRLAKHSFLKMLEEFQNGGFGSELRLRSLLMEVLVSLFRWEETSGNSSLLLSAATNWSQIQRALQYIHEHHSEVIYVRQLAQAVRVGERQLNGLFRDLLGMGFIQYLNAYRVTLAASMLGTSGNAVTTVAFSVGFETLSHFNTTFRSVMGMSPTEYVKKIGKIETDADHRESLEHLGLPAAVRSNWCAKAV